MPQRPAWTFPARWLPAALNGGGPGIRPLPVAILLVVAALIAAIAIAIGVGTSAVCRRRSGLLRTVPIVYDTGNGGHAYVADANGLNCATAARRRHRATADVLARRHADRLLLPPARRPGREHRSARQRVPHLWSPTPTDRTRTRSSAGMTFRLDAVHTRRPGRRTPARSHSERTPTASTRSGS